MHEHTEQGQTLRHSHPGGDRPHGYFEHPEDGFPYPASTTPLADALAGVEHAQGQGGQFGLGTAHELAALRDLAEAVRAHLDKDPEPAAVRDAVIAWQNGEEGARDRLNTIFASWAANSLPVSMQGRQEIADSIAMTITAGIAPYLEAAVLRLAAQVREASPLAALLAKVAARPDAAEALAFVLEQPVGGPSCGCGLRHWDCDEDVPDEDGTVYGGYTHEQLKAAFELVKPVGNWKGPIKATVPGSTDVMAIHAAVTFFTGGEATIVSDPKFGTLHVTAPGYYACIGS
jgi:hypothetical protein